MSRTAVVRTTVADAVIRFLVAQRVAHPDPSGAPGQDLPLVPGAFAIFGHGNALGIGQALEARRAELPTWRGQSEQGMALAAVAYAKASRRRQVPIVTTSIGPGALNVVTAAGVAMANRLPLLVLAADTFASRGPDPVLQQVEHFGHPSTTVNDAFRAVTRYWDRVTEPEQLLSTLPQAVATLLDPADCGPVLLSLPQDVQARAYDFPAAFFRPTVHAVRRPRPSRDEVAAAVTALRGARRPLVIAGGGVHYSLAEAALSAFAARHGLPVLETVAGKSCLTSDDPSWAGPIGITGTDPANALAAEADVVLAVGTRLQDFTTGSWTIFQDPDLTVVGVNAARFDAAKRRARPVVGDALEALRELDELLGDWRADASWTRRGRDTAGRIRDEVTRRCADDGSAAPSYAQVVGTVNAVATPDDYVLTAAGGLPGELNVNWMSKGVATFDCEYGFSCMGYEVSGTWGAAMQRDTGTVFGLTGDGSYLMLSSDVYSAVLHGQRLVLVVCDNGGFAVIDRLQTGHGAASFRTMLAEQDVPAPPRVDFVAHAAAMGALARRVTGLRELRCALEEVRHEPGVHVLVLETAPSAWTEGSAFWEVGVPEVSDRPQVREARAALERGKATQKAGW